jgi:hypothetical protein
MITQYKIPCSTCGKVVERYIFCSGACRVTGHRNRKNPKDTHVQEIDPLIEPVIETVFDKINSEIPQFSDRKLPGYHFVQSVNRYVKD